MLATHSAAHPGFPYGSVVPYCLGQAGLPALLLGHLAQRWRNPLRNSARSLLLFQSGSGDVQETTRLNLVTHAEPDAPEAARKRYFHHFPHTRIYHEQLNFSFFHLCPGHCHVNAGFALARWLGMDRIARPMALAADAEMRLCEYAQSQQTMGPGSNANDICIDKSQLFAKNLKYLHLHWPGIKKQTAAKITFSLDCFITLEALTAGVCPAPTAVAHSAGAKMTPLSICQVRLLGAALTVALLIPCHSAIAGNTPTSTADHSKFEELQQDFKTGPEVTQACLGCHTEAARQLHKTTHWTWAFENELTGQTLGKKNVINNFCVATATNWPRCTSCHIGYGWKDDNFDLNSETSVDCLACHDTTGTYKKFPTGAGHPNYLPQKWPPKKGKLRQPPDLKKIAQGVGKPSRNNCGSCHFYGGGGDGVKHGHLDSSLHNPAKALDVHMDAEGLDFSCQTCHTAGGHEITGSRYTTRAADERGMIIPGQPDQNRATCESCHGNTAHGPDADEKLNSHTDKVACVTCHVPEFARGGRKTKTWWDWSTAGKKDENGKPMVKKDADGYPVYHFKKGDFVWQENVIPEYFWYDGEIRYTLFGEAIDDTGVVPINQIKGSFYDPGSRIWPFKVMRGKQPYDKKLKILAIPHLFGKDPDAFWKSFDWNKALSAGLMSRGKEFSGEYGFVETAYYWPVTHMVAPKENSLGCADCHSRDGRLAGVPGFYLPGRDRNDTLDLIGWLLLLVSISGVSIHGVGRLISNKARNS